MLDKIALLRSVVSAIDEHSDSNLMTGCSEVVKAVDPPTRFGSEVSQYRPSSNDMLAYVSQRDRSRFGSEPTSRGLAPRWF